LQDSRCCDKAVHLTDYTDSFIIQIEKKRNLKKNNNLIIYSPRIWKEQSVNYFMSLLRAILILPKTIIERYKRFENSNFFITNLKQYKGGKESVIRTAITGFVAIGIYQTATISCSLPHDEILIPAKIYDMMKERYHLDMVFIKRDPSFHQTSMFVMKGKRNEDEEAMTIIIPDCISKPLNQDQDGDKNGIYVLEKYTINKYDRRQSLNFRISLLEMRNAITTTHTITGKSRYNMSEYARLMMYRGRETFFKDDLFIQIIKRLKYHDTKTPDFIQNVGITYLKEEFNMFRKRYKNLKQETLITLDDMLMRNDTLHSIVESGAKGSMMSLNVFFENLIRDDDPTSLRLQERKTEMMEQMNRYIDSSTLLSKTGRSQFVLLTAFEDLIVLSGIVYLNGRPLLDMRDASLSFSLMFDEAALCAFFDDCMYDFLNE
jgi:hypothetical protein